MGFFERHAATIKHISLSGIILPEDWADNLECVQRLLDLETMQFGSYLYRDDPDQYWSLAPPAYISSNDDSVSANRLRDYDEPWRNTRCRAVFARCTIAACIDSTAMLRSADQKGIAEEPILITFFSHS